MTSITFTHIRHANRRQGVSSGHGSGIYTAIAEAMTTMLERWRQRRTLAGLSDDMLKDIGVSRADAYRESVKPFWEA